MQDPRDTPVTDVDGIGRKRGQALFASYRIETVQDLLYFYPRRYADRSEHKPIARLEEGDEALVSGDLTNLRVKGSGSKRRLVAVVKGASGAKVEGVWFRGINALRNVLKRMDEIAMFGEAARYGRRLSMSHPEFYEAGEEMSSLDVGRIVPFYPHGERLGDSGLSQSKLREVIHGVIESLSREEMPAYLPSSVEEELGLMPGHEAIEAAHFPESEEQVGRARRRIKFEELFFLQLLMARERKRRQDAPAIEVSGGGLAEEFADSLPFEFTSDQAQAIQDIEDDIRKSYQMNRLLQGDVGAGKTVVAIMSMLRAVENGGQAAFLAPTSVLAEQHHKTLKGYLEPLGIDPVLLKSDLTKSELEERREDVAAGAPVTVGTHALIQEDTEFEDLQFAVVDEQHRFGVEQRRNMFKMGTRPHKLLMTATPIPRSLAMGLYGDLDVSTIKEMPPGRKPVDTRWLGEREMDSVFEFIRQEVANGYQVFVVYPLKKPSPDSELQDLKNGARRVQQQVPSALVERVHGESDEKDEIMEAFASGDIDVLCSTTVVEVGVDVPNATTMIVKEADFFGLSQLHQLRGRVGRSDVQSYCMLMTQGEVTDKAQRRLSAMAETNDGFEIAETDLDIRGVGNFLGTRQSGMPGTHMANVREDAGIMEEARDVATEMVESDPSLSGYPNAQDVLARRFGGEEAELAQVG
jgi:ATP-dependent DNA helicase RecG